MDHAARFPPCWQLTTWGAAIVTWIVTQGRFCPNPVPRLGRGADRLDYSYIDRLALGG